MAYWQNSDNPLDFATVVIDSLSFGTEAVSVMGRDIIGVRILLEFAVSFASFEEEFDLIDFSRRILGFDV